MDALDPWRLAALYGVKVIPLSTLAIGAEIRDHFSVARPDMFSGALVPIGKGAVIVENDSHPSVRRRSTLGHELAHVFGEHKFATSLVNERGCRPDARG
jgi:Zn-dependent peptidase ImmA (M78 family)